MVGEGARGEKGESDGDRSGLGVALSKRRVISLAMTSNTIPVGRVCEPQTSNIVALRRISQYGISVAAWPVTPKGIIVGFSANVARTTTLERDTDWSYSLIVVPLLLSLSRRCCRAIRAVERVYCTCRVRFISSGAAPVVLRSSRGSFHLREEAKMWVAIFSDWKDECFSRRKTRLLKEMVWRIPVNG